jgi:hypothetical protein
VAEGNGRSGERGEDDCEQAPHGAGECTGEPQDGFARAKVRATAGTGARTSPDG